MVQSASEIPQIVKSCSCGARYTKDEWEQLTLARKHGGRMTYPGGEVHEHRKCHGCGSHIVVVKLQRRSPSGRYLHLVEANPAE